MVNEKILENYSTGTDSLMRFPSYSGEHAIAIFGKKKNEKVSYFVFTLKFFRWPSLPYGHHLRTYPTFKRNRTARLYYVWFYFLLHIKFYVFFFKRLLKWCFSYFVEKKLGNATVFTVQVYPVCISRLISTCRTCYIKIYFAKLVALSFAILWADCLFLQNWHANY